MYDILIVGGGTAGLTAAIYARRAGKTVLVTPSSHGGSAWAGGWTGIWGCTAPQWSKT